MEQAETTKSLEQRFPLLIERSGEGRSVTDEYGFLPKKRSATFDAAVIAEKATDLALSMLQQMNPRALPPSRNPQPLRRLVLEYGTADELCLMYTSDLYNIVGYEEDEVVDRILQSGQPHHLAAVFAHGSRDATGMSESARNRLAAASAPRTPE
jgi:hypothetical protein